MHKFPTSSRNGTKQIVTSLLQNNGFRYHPVKWRSFPYSSSQYQSFISLSPTCHQNYYRRCYLWLDDVKKLLEKDNLEDGEWISWAAYHASITEPPLFPPSQSRCWHCLWSLAPAQLWLGMQWKFSVSQPSIWIQIRLLLWLWIKHFFLLTGHSQEEFVEVSFLVILVPMYTETIGQSATIIPRPVRVIEIVQGAAFPELSHSVLQ